MKPLYETGPPRGAWRWEPKMHRTLAEIDAGVGPDPMDVIQHRAEKIRTAKWLKAIDPNGGK